MAAGPIEILSTAAVALDPTARTPSAPAGPEEGRSREDQLFYYYCHYVELHGQHPEKHLFADFIYRAFGQTGQSGAGPVSVQSLRRYWGNLEARYRSEVHAPQQLEASPAEAPQPPGQANGARRCGFWQADK